MTKEADIAQIRDPMQRKCIVRVPAKINLSLDVVGSRPDGYHLLETVMQAVGIYDTVEVGICDNAEAGLVPDPDAKAPGFPEIAVECEDPAVPCDSRNTAYKAAFAYLERWMAKRGAAEPPPAKVTVRIHKGIPREAGLGGGSADAAGTLAGLDSLLGGVLTQEEMLSAAVCTGADVPFCLSGGTALCTGIGEIVEPAPDFGGHPLTVVKPAFGIATPWAFHRFDSMEPARRPDTGAVLLALERGDAIGLFDVTANVLEEVAMAEYPLLGDIKRSLGEEKGCCGSLMSGSGTAVFAVYERSEDARRAAARMRRKYPAPDFRIDVTQTVSDGPRIIGE